MLAGPLLKSPPMLNCHNRQIILTIKHTSRQDFWHIITLQDSGEGEEGGASAFFFNDHLSGVLLPPQLALEAEGSGSFPEACSNYTYICPVHL